MPIHPYTYPQQKSVYKAIIALFIAFLTSCTPSVDMPESYNMEAWKNDRNGCKGERIEMAEDIKASGNKFIGLKEREIISLFGKPDKEMLKRRMNKTYIYYLHPSESCEKPSESTYSLRIEFEALGRVKLVTLQKSGV